MGDKPGDRSSCDIFLPNDRATRDLGAQLAGVVFAGCVVLLDGPLGAGKTTLVQGFAAAIGAENAPSPSFVLARSIPGGRIPLWHLDLYRIEDRAEIEDLDLDQYLLRDSVAFVEWASRAPGAWPPDRFEIDLRVEGEARRAVVVGYGRCAALISSVAPLAHQP